MDIRYKFKIGDKVNYTNSNGVNLGERTIVGLDTRTGEPTYYITPTDTPWFSVRQEELVTIKELHRKWDKDGLGA